MDFLKIKEKITKEKIEIYPDFVVGPSKDLMIRGKNFYAIWNEKTGLWSTDETDVPKIIDQAVYDYANEKYSKNEYLVFKTMASFDDGILVKYRKFLSNMYDVYVQLDNKIMFKNSKIKKTDYVSKRLDYDLREGDIKSYDELMSTLYLPQEREKLEWAIGAIISGDSKFIQKFIVLYGETGSGKSTFLNIVQKLFEGYYSMFDAKTLTSTSQFAIEAFRSNPLIAIQHDGDLSKIEDNTKINSIVSHEEMIMNEKYKQTYTTRINCFLFMGTNQPVKISDAKSGILRRLIDVHPSGNKVPTKRYYQLMELIDYELGAIAYHCLQVYKKLGKSYYFNYRPTDMMFKTNIFFNFVAENYLLFKKEDGTTLNQAYAMYKEFIDEGSYQHKLQKHIFREELKVYFVNYWEFKRIEGKTARNVYQGFKWEKILGVKDIKEEDIILDLSETKSNFDIVYQNQSAQYANEKEAPSRRWENVTLTLADIDTSKLHYVKLPSNHIVIDFDLKDENSQKSRDLNLKTAANWPSTYSEFSKSGQGVHLHYIYDGDITKLKSIFSEGIEIKTFTGNSSIRRKLTFCNAEPINHILDGLPLKGEKMIHISQIKNEQGLRKLITRNLNKEIHSGTKPSIDFIYKILEDAAQSDLIYDISDMRNKVLTFATNSTNNSEYCVNLVNKMKFVSVNFEREIYPDMEAFDVDEMVFYDVEVFPNLFVVSYKAAGADKQCVSMINPTPLEIEQLFKFKLIGFNCRRYDNHILYARYLGYDNKQLYDLSQKIIFSEGGNTGLFGEAYNISYTDVYDFCSIKQSLKKWEIDLDIPHMELGYKWDEPVPEENWGKVVEYCENDVKRLEEVFNARQGDWVARQILADLAGGSVNDTTNQLTTKLIFGNDRHPQLVYTDLATGVQS